MSPHIRLPTLSRGGQLDAAAGAVGLAKAVLCFMLSIVLVIPSLFIGGLWRISLGLFVIGWVLQFIGHYYEGKPPEFLKDYRFLLVGSRWWFKKTFG